MGFRVLGDSQVHQFPGAYARSEVIADVGAPIDPFQVGVMVGRQRIGVPYNANGATGQGEETLFRLAQTSLDMKQHTGPDSELSLAFQAAKAAYTPLPQAYYLGVSPTTKSSAVLKDAVAADSIDIASRDWGAPTGDIQIEIVDGGEANSHVIKMTPPKNAVFLTADSGTDQVIEVGVILPYMRAGAKVYLTDNVTARVEKTIESVDETNKRITFTTAIAASVTVANDARIYQEDAGLREISGDLLTLDDVEAFFAESQLLSGVRSDTATDIPDNLAKTSVKEIAGATAGTSPAPQAADWTALFDLLPNVMNDFAIKTGLRMRVFYPVTPTHTIHQQWATFAASQRQAGDPIAVVVGGALDELDFSADTAPTDPENKLQDIDNEDIQVALGGLDGQAPYFSFAAQLFAIRCAHNVIHTQTRDKIRVAVPEQYWIEGDANGELLLDRGGSILTVPKLNPQRGFVLAKGQNSLQSRNDASTWNTDGTTWIIRQRDLADISQRVTLQAVDQLVGSDGIGGQGITESQIRSILVNQVIPTLVARGYVLSGNIASITQDGEGWQVQVDYNLPGETNYIGIVFRLHAAG